MDIFELIRMKYIISALVFSGLGTMVFVFCFVMLEFLTPKVSVWKEITEKQNVALAILLAAVVYGIATIISAAIQS